MKRFLALGLFVVIVAQPALAAKLRFENRSGASIPLEIPGVMNPNLSPKSSSGVTLERGQKVYFRVDGRRVLLLEIGDQQDGEVIVVDALIEQRRRELGAD